MQAALQSQGLNASDVRLVVSDPVASTTTASSTCPYGAVGSSCIGALLLLSVCRQGYLLGAAGENAACSQPFVS